MRMFRFDELPKTIVLTWMILACAGLANAQANARSDNGDKNSPTPPGLYITPTALPIAAQQELNPGLKNYPNFVAGEAVKAVVSPDGKTLAILTAGMNSLYVSNPNHDTSNHVATIEPGASKILLILHFISSVN